MKATSEDYSHFIENQMSTLKTLLVNTSKLISNNSKNKLSINESQLCKTFLDTNNTLSLISSMYFVKNMDGTVLNSSGINSTIEDLNIDLRKRSWYKSTLNSNEVLVSNVYSDIDNHKPVITLSYMIKSKNEVLGVIAADIFLEDFNKEFNLFSQSHNLNNYILDKNGTGIIHEIKDLIGKNIMNLNSKKFNNEKISRNLFTNYTDLWDNHFSKENSGTIYYKDFTARYAYAYFKKIENLNWIVVCKTYESLLIKETLSSLWNLLLLELILFTILFITIYKLLKINYYIDKITGLFNKNYLIHMMRKKRKNIAEQHILIININNFSSINSNYGGFIGDIVLKRLAKITTLYIGTECNIIRLEPDNFLCVFKENIWEKSIYNSKLLHSKIKDFTVEETNLLINVSLFMALISVKESYLKDVKTGIFLTERIIKDLKQKHTQNLIICSDINDIIENKKHNDSKIQFLIDSVKYDRLVPFFQPIVDVDTMVIHKYEVLMRIKQKNSYLSPYPYVLLAEEHNLIDSMDLIVIEKAIKYKHLNDNHNEFELSINLSGKELENSEHINKVMQIIDKYNIPHKKIIFEITETQNIENLSKVSTLIKEIKELGFKFSIDDFGTGFSSIQYLKLLPIDYIKIDGSFIRDILNKEENQYLVKAMVNMAKAFKIKIVAEFVEDENILKKIKELGIDYGQGYFIGMPSETFID